VATYHATGLTLLARKYRGTGRVLTFYTRDRGRIEAVAQGVGKPGSTLAASAELFALSDLLIAEARGLDRVSQARVTEAFEPLRRDPLAFGYAGLLCELVAHATPPDEPMPHIFDDLVEALRLLAQGEEAQPVAAAAAWRILGALGVVPDLRACARCGADVPGATVYLADEGGVVCEACFTAADGAAEVSVPVSPPLRSLTETLASMPLARVPRIKVAPDLWQSLLRLVRLQARFYLGLDLRADDYLRQIEHRRRPESPSSSAPA
jgi:DNA repair protein RecO (recombination protein O)